MYNKKILIILTNFLWISRISSQNETLNSTDLNISKNENSLILDPVPKNDDKKNLYIGLGIGVFILVVIIIFLAYNKWFKNSINIIEYNKINNFINQLNKFNVTNITTKKSDTSSIKCYKNIFMGREKYSSDIDYPKNIKNPIHHEKYYLFIKQNDKNYGLYMAVDMKNHILHIDYININTETELPNRSEKMDLLNHNPLSYITLQDILTNDQDIDPLITKIHQILTNLNKDETELEKLIIGGESLYSPKFPLNYKKYPLSNNVNKDMVELNKDLINNVFSLMEVLANKI